jgi:hypothetical protein
MAAARMRERKARRATAAGWLKLFATPAGNLPMSDTASLIEHYYDAFNRGDWEAMLACLTEDVTHDLNQG